MKPAHWRLAPSSNTRPQSAPGIEAAGLTLAVAQANTPLEEIYRQVPNLLTAIMLQAEAMRRYSMTPRVDEAAIASSCEHITECTKRLWDLFVDHYGTNVRL